MTEPPKKKMIMDTLGKMPQKVMHQPAETKKERVALASKMELVWISNHMWTRPDRRLSGKFARKYWRFVRGWRPNKLLDFKRKHCT